MQHHSEQIGMSKTELLQRKYTELSQNQIMHVLEHYCECIEEKDWTAILNALLSQLRNVRLHCMVEKQSEEAVAMILLRALNHFIHWVSLIAFDDTQNPIRRNNFQNVFHTLYKVCLQQPEDQEEMFFIFYTVSILQSYSSQLFCL